MIKIFRNIRKKLATENKISAYLRYAVGEILLVVIGILIAVQINSYVSNTKLKEDNKLFLTKMIQELQLNKQRMQFIRFDSVKGQKKIVYISLEKAIENCNTLLIKTYKGLTKADLPFIINSELSAGGSYLNLNKSTYEELINTGKLYTLGSDSLIKAINNYYKRCEREDLYNKENTEDMNDGFKLMEKNLGKLKLDYVMDSTHFSLNNYPWFFNKKSQPYQDMQIGINKVIGGQSSNYIKMEQIIQYSDSLIVKIKAELKQETND